MTIKVKHILPFSILVLLIHTKYIIWCAPIYDFNDDAHGVRFAANDKFVVGAFNTFQRYALRSLLKSTHTECTVLYPNPEFYVYSLDTVDLANITTNSSELAAFVQIAENMTTSSDSLTNVVLTLFIVNISSTDCTAEKMFVKTIEHIIWSNETHQEYMLLKVDPQQKYVYVFTDLVVFSYELATNTFNQVVYMNDTVFWQNLTKISVRSFDLTDEWALVAAYAREPDTVRSRYQALLLELKPLRLVTSQIFFLYDFQTSETLSYNLIYDLSVAIAPDRSLAAISAPYLNSVSLCKIDRSQNDNQSDWTMVLERRAITTASLRLDTA